ncbi:MAG TPA: hypothetical protein VHL59_14630 [Thermoanaerobaculia bacterium]|nr:hypothetical protein [Thermoanaerobaculia bacterium]
MTAFRRAALTAFALVVAASAQAQSLLARGDVLVQISETGASIDETPPESALIQYAPDGTEKRKLPRALEARYGLLTPSPNRLLSSQFGSVVISDDASTIADRVLESLNLRELSEVVTNRAGELFVAETIGRARHLPARLVRFSAAGEVLRVYSLELLPRGSSITWSAGPAHMELLADQCTLVYTLGDELLDARRVMRFDVCTGHPMPDLLALAPRFGMGGSVRQLPNGDILIATARDVRRFDSSGKLVLVYRVPAVRIALTPEATGFWFADNFFLQRIDFANPDVIAERVVLPPLGNVLALAVVGEWRAAANFVKRRPVRK